MTEVTSSSSLAISCSSWDLALVYSSVEPGGVWMIAVDDALVLARDEARREPHLDGEDADDKRRDEAMDHAARDDPPQDARVTVGDPFDGAVERLRTRARE